jgi:glycosyltransferase involved in cell wall biosynthesis
MPAPLLLCTKSNWNPPIRREHAWAEMASTHGHSVTFVERPSDVRAIRTLGSGPFVRQLVGRPRLVQEDSGVFTYPRSVIVPGHRSEMAARANTRLLARALRSVSTSETSIVVSWPWDWRAAKASPAHRRVFDMADDWGRLMPGRQARFADYYREIANEADEIIVVSADLRTHFRTREPIVIRNGVGEEALKALPAEQAEPKTITYVGTLSERFDAGLMQNVLSILDGWRLEIVGACMYAGLGRDPAPELERLLSLGDRVRWHGPLSRTDALPWIDRSAVAVVPNRPAYSAGQDSMKFYDYAARGRPIVSTSWFSDTMVDSPPHLRVADDVKAFADAIVSAAGEGEDALAELQRWAAQQAWSTRWSAWSTAVFGA